MSIKYQWIKFRDDAEFQSTDLQPGSWVLAEIDDEWPDGGISLFGVDYMMRQSQVLEWGPEVLRPASA